MATILSQGFAKCLMEPRGDNGLEGYQLNSDYPYEYVDKDKYGKPFYRVFPDKRDTPDYYETCGPKAFHQYFKEIA